jgi:hypothetical protein
LNNSGISGGTFAVNMVGVSGDGAIYVGNLTTADAAGSPFKVYRWATEGAVPTLAYSSATLLAGARIGDSFAISSGASTRIAAGFGNSPAITGNNGYAIIDPTLATGDAIAFSGTPPDAGDFRLGITFSDSSHVLGSQGNSLFRYTSFSGTSGTLLASPALTSSAERLLTYAVVGGVPLLAVQSTGDSHVSLFDMTDPLNPVFITSVNNTSGTLTLNSNGTGDLAFGNISGNTADLYAMSSNQGIQAFVITVPEPTTVSLAVLALGSLCLARRINRRH